MPEGVRPYPRWDGPLNAAPPFLPIIGNEFRRALRSLWFMMALGFILLYSIVYIGNAFSAGPSEDEASIEDYVVFLTRPSVNFAGVGLEMSFAPVMVAAIIGGPAILEDARRGALDLYFSRSLTAPEYLIAKILAVMGVTTLALFVPGFLYWIASFLFFENFPDGWALLPLKTLAYALIWGVCVSGLALGLSATSKSSRAATLILIGGVLLLHGVVSNLLESITRNGDWQIISPLSAMQKLSEYIFNVDVPFEFPTWWAAAEIAALTVIGWLLLAWKRPRLRGA